MAVNKSLATRDASLAPRLLGWSPFREIERMRNEIDALFNSLLDFPSITPGFGRWLGGQDTAVFPRAEMQETDNEVILSAAVPGLSEKEIEVTLTDDTISITGKKCEETKEGEEKGSSATAFRQEYHGLFRLPPYVDTKKAKAKYKNGVLDVILPKKEEVKAKPLKIEVEEG